jgi:hypothetical protein
VLRLIGYLVRLKRTDEGGRTPHARALVSFSTNMAAHPNVYVFLSGDRKTFGLSVDPNGANLPSAHLVGGWKAYDVMPMTLHDISRYTSVPSYAHAELIAWGYYLTRTHGTIIPFAKSPPR